MSKETKKGQSFEKGTVPLDSMIFDPAEGSKISDLDPYNVVIRAPVTGSYREYTLTSTPPPSAGGLTVLQMLKMLERFPIGDEDLGIGFGAFKTLNVMIEAMRLAFADRAVWMGDAGFVAVPKKV